MADPRILRNLKKGREGRSILVRVVRKWTLYDTAGNNLPLHVGMVFADEKGAAMYAQVSDELIEKKGKLFDVGKVYSIKKFIVSDNKKTFKAVNGPFMIDITQYTEADVVRDPPSTIPDHVYSLTPFAAIKPTKILLNYIDVIGYLVKYEALRAFVPKNREKGKMLREIYIKDLRGDVMKITLWGDHAANFNIENIYDDKAGNLIVCLVVGCMPRKDWLNNDKVALTGSAACAYYLNPQIPEAASFHSRFKDTPVYIEQPLESDEAALPMIRDIELPQKTVADLETIDPFNEQEPGPFKCVVTIAAILSIGNWWYMSCRPCKKKADQQFDRSYKCPKCNGSDIVPRYTVTFLGKDETAEARFFAYDDEAQKIIQKDCESVIASWESRANLPQPLKNIINKTFVFSVDLTDESIKNMKIREYQIKAVLERPTRRSNTQLMAVAETQMATVDTGPRDIVPVPATDMLLSSPQQHESLLQIEKAIKKTPAPAIAIDIETKKDGKKRLAEGTSAAQRSLSSELLRTTEWTHEQDPQNTDVTEIDDDNNDEMRFSPPSKTSRHTVEKKSSRSASHK